MTAVVQHAEQATTISREQIELVKDTIAREQNLTDGELRLLLYTAQRLGLDPLAKQIYAVRRKGKMVIQTGIDGFRSIAARTGEYAGSDDAIFDNEQKPTKATVTVYRLVGGMRCAFSASARWDQYYPGEDQGFMWRKMPHVMLGKCAEGLALRKAFPAQLAGLYTDDEMAQAGPSDQVPEESHGKPAAAKDAPPTGPVWPFGNNKGTPLTHLSSDDLTAGLDWLQKKDAVKFAKLIEQVENELESRRGE